MKAPGVPAGLGLQVPKHKQLRQRQSELGGQGDPALAVARGSHSLGCGGVPTFRKTRGWLRAQRTAGGVVPGLEMQPQTPAAVGLAGFQTPPATPPRRPRPLSNPEHRDPCPAPGQPRPAGGLRSHRPAGGEAGALHLGAVLTGWTWAPAPRPTPTMYPTSICT